MSHRSSEPPLSQSSSPSTSPRPQPPSTSSPSMIQVGRPILAAPPSFSTLASRYTPQSSQFVADTIPRPITSPSPSPTDNRPSTPPESMRASEHERGVKRGRSEEEDEDAEDRQGSDSGSEASANVEQPIMPAPKKRTRTLMTPDQLTALHRLLSQTRFPTTEQREQCGREIGLSARRVQVWFQNQRQKSKAQQQASAAAGGSRQTLAPQPGPYRVFNYNSSYYEPPIRPYTSPHPHTYGEQPHHSLETSPTLRRSQRLGHHRRGTSSLSYIAPPPSSRYEYASGSYPPPPYTATESEFSHSPVPYYERYQSPARVRSPEPGGSLRDDTTLPPIWPGNEQPSYAESSVPRPSLSPVAPTSTSLTRRPSLLPTGLPPPQPLEPAPLWNHPHTNPRYMRPLPPTSGLPSLISGLSRGRARSDPPASSLLATSGLAHRPDRGLGLELHGIRPSANPAAREDASSSPERMYSDPITLRMRRPEPLPARSPRLGQPPESSSGSARARTRGRTHSRHSSGDSQNGGRD